MVLKNLLYNLAKRFHEVIIPQREVPPFLGQKTTPALYPVQRKGVL